jgi:hypothetical protein
MRRWLTHLATAVFTAALLLVVALLGQVPLGRASDQSTLRLALRAVQGKAEVCRDRTSSELEALPAHMRQPTVCDEVAPAYRLRVRIDLRTRLDEEFEPGGLRGDRPLIVDRRILHSAGTARVQVELRPVLDEATRQSLQEAGSLPPEYSFDRRIHLPADRVTLLLLDETEGRLVLYNETVAER